MSIRNEQYVRYFTDVIQGVFKCVTNNKKEKKIIHDRNRIIKKFEYIISIKISLSNQVIRLCLYVYY